jgi:hypothetical protein
VTPINQSENEAAAARGRIPAAAIDFGRKHWCKQCRPIFYNSLTTVV